MKKLIQGIVEFRRNIQKSYKESFGKLAIGQKPDSLFIACSDSRVVPNVFASTNPGDLFVIRNVGNMIPACNHDGVSDSDESEAAAIEYAVENLKIKEVIICGHSECGAMQAVLDGRSKVEMMPNLRSWLRHGDHALDKFKTGFSLDTSLSSHNQISQINVLTQMEHIHSYPSVQKRVQEGSLRLHGWWFDIANADVYSYSSDANKFVIIDEAESEKILKKLGY